MHPIENIMQTSMTQIKNMVDVNTIVGSPICLLYTSDAADE